MSFTKEELALPKEDWKLLLERRGLKLTTVPKEITNLRRKTLNKYSARKSVDNRKTKMQVLENTVKFLQEELKKYKDMYETLKVENTVLMIENDSLKNEDDFLKDLGFDL